MFKQQLSTGWGLGGSNSVLPHGTVGNGWRRIWLSPRGGGGEILLASGGWRPGMPLNTLQCAGQAPTAENDLALDVSSAVMGTETDQSRAVTLD